MSSGETWVLSELLTAFGTSSKQFTINFTFDNVKYTGIDYIFSSPMQSDLWWSGETSLHVYNYTQATWATSVSRTIIFDEPVTDTTLLAWLQENGTKQ